MDTFTVYFAGLMIHVGEDTDLVGIEKKHVALIDAPEHVPIIRINAEFLEGSNPDAPPWEYPLTKGDEVSFSLKPGVATTNSAFRRGIPSLTAVTKKGAAKASLDLPVKLRKSHGDIASYVLYPAGNLSVYSYFEHRGKYVLDGAPIDERCIAYVTQFTASTDDPVTITIWKGTGGMVSKRVKKDGEVCILNLDHPPTTPGHFQHYKSATDASHIASVEETDDCERHDAKYGAPCQGDYMAPHPEGSNSTWP